MQIKERIQAFNKNNSPLYLIDMDGESFHLCMQRDGLSDDDYFRVQDLFDDYAKANGETAKEGNRHRYGGGNDWEAVFREAFKSDPNLQQITFDCEYSGFYCECTNFDLIEDFGRRFKEVFDNNKILQRCITDGIPAEKVRLEEEERLANCVEGYFLKHSCTDFYIRTTDADYYLDADMVKGVLDGSITSVKEEGNDSFIDAEKLLALKVTAAQQDLFCEEYFRIKAEPAPEQTMSLKM